MPTRRNNMTPKQAAFVKAYLSNGHNGNAAYRAAYNSKASPKNITVEVQRLLRNPRIAPVIIAADTRAAAAVEKKVKEFVMSREGIIDELTKLGAADVDYVSANDKRSALVDLAKLAGYYVEKQDVTHHSSYDGMSDDELRERIAARARRDATDDGRVGAPRLRKVAG